MLGSRHFGQNDSRFKSIENVRSQFLERAEIRNGCLVENGAFISTLIRTRGQSAVGAVSILRASLRAAAKTDSISNELAVRGERIYIFSVPRQSSRLVSGGESRNVWPFCDLYQTLAKFVVVCKIRR
jgi:hypothetical protein